MTPEIAKIFGCPFCEFRVSGTERVCPRCGRDFSEGIEFECPFCGSPVKPAAGSCPGCEVQFSKMAAQVSERLLDKAVEKISDELDTLAKLDSMAPRCPTCSGPLKAPGAPCEKCEERRIAALEKKGGSVKEYLDDELFGEREVEEFACPNCGAAVGPRDPTCKHCGAEFVDEEEEVSAEAPSGRAAGIEATAPAVEEEVVTCPMCDSVVSRFDPRCPHCGAEFEEEEVELPPEHEPEIAPSDEGELASCPVCGALAGLTAKACPSCGAEFEDAEDVIEAEEVVVAPIPQKQIVKPKVVARKKGRIITPSRIAPKEEPRRGLSNGIGAVNGRGRTNGSGRVNGKPYINGVGAVNGRINGQGRINGAGAINGRALVNGTGALNGGGAGVIKPGTPRGRYQLLLRWRVLVLLVALVVVLATFWYMAGVVEKSPYEVDGDGGDWSDATMFSIASASPSPSTNVVEWSVAPHRNELYIYVRTEEPLMSSNDVESFYLFIDSDSSASTGYTILGTGANFMIELQGWNESVMQSTVWRYDSHDDQLDWSSWAYAAAAVAAIEGDELEARIWLPFEVEDDSRFMLVSRGQQAAGCASYPVVLRGGLLVVGVSPTPDVAADGILTAYQSAQLVSLTFRCEGEGGTVSSVTPELVGIASSSAIQQFSIEPGEEHTIELLVDSSELTAGQFVSVTVESDDISSTFSKIHMVGESVKAYVGSAPDTISIDGAFADWAGRTVTDFDPAPLANPDIDIDEVGAHNSTVDSFFYISVRGDMCSGDFVPEIGSKPSGTGGGAVVPTRRTAEDFMSVYIDSDQSAATGSIITSDGTPIGADYLIEITGLCGEIKSTAVMMFHTNGWVELETPVDAAIDLSRMEIGVPSSGIGASTGPIDFLIISTDWKGNEDLASNDTVTLRTKHWLVASESSEKATSMSYQRKMFYDGTNFWSFHYDGDDTVYMYSSDGGATWNSGGQVFSTSDVLDVSLWYDASSLLVYVVGDTSALSTNVYLRRGSVSPGTPSISWGDEETLSVSPDSSVGGKNTFICKDTNGNLWVLSSQRTDPSPERYNLVAYMSDEVDDITSWTESGTMLSSDSENGDLKGSILPAGSGNDVWAVYNHDTFVDARKCTSGSWGSVETVYTDSGVVGFMNIAPASAVVDGNGVVHVVYGDANKDGGAEKPHIQYRYRNTDGWDAEINLDGDADTVNHRYPTISLDESTGNVYAFWIQVNNFNIMCKRNVSGTWGFVTLGGQTTYPKQYLTSVYSAPGETNICWQWTQNTTTPIDVVFDKIPEFGNLTFPIIIVMAVFLMISRRRRRKDSALQEDC